MDDKVKEHEFKYSCRWGRFRLDWEILRSLSTVGVDSPLFKQLTSLMSNILIFRASESPWNGQIEYWGISPLFDEVPEGEDIPFYSLEGQTIQDEETGHCEYIVKAFKKIK